MAALVLPSILGVSAPAWATASEPDERFLAVYDGFANVPTDAAFINAGLRVDKRLQSIPGVILFGQLASAPSSHLDYTERDGPQEYFLQTATFATNAADVWGSTWWPVPSQVQRKDPSPLLLNGSTIDGAGVVVGVVDSGINALHPDLWYAPAAAGPLRPKVLACINMPETSDAASQPYCDETVGHGTHVAGIVAGTGFAARSGLAPGVDPEAPPVGAAPGAQMVAFGLGAGLFILNAVEALDYVAANHAQWGIRVVTNSWGGAGSCTNSLPSSAVNQISNVLIDGGVTVLFAAGNYQTVPTAAPTWASPHAINPKPGLISVANYNDQNSGTRDGAINGGSSDGCVAAGGAQDLLWTWPDVSAPGTNVLSTAAYTGTLIPGLDGGFYGTASGTSMATPHVAGIVALMLQANPDLTPAQVERVLVETSTPFSDGAAARGITGTTPMWGSNLVNNPIAGFSDPSQCKVTPNDAARAEAGDTAVNAKFPRFTELAAVTDADLFVCRDFKRGHGLVDAYAAVKRALSMRGDNQGVPEVTIGEPADGAQVDAGIVAVSGLVDRLGGVGNNPPTAGLSADTVGGPAPLSTTFTLLGSDTDGSVASWSLDFGDGTAAAAGTSLPTTRAHTYGANGAYTATLTVTDDDGATGSDTIAIEVGGLPVPDGTITGSLFTYNVGGTLGISNVAAILTGATTGDNVPKYAAGELVGSSSRSTVSADAAVAIGPGTAAEFTLFDEQGGIAFGPLVASGSLEDPTLAGCTDCYSYDTPTYQIPATLGGRYYMGMKLTVNGNAYWVFDPDYNGLKPVDVIGVGQATSTPLPLSLADLDGRATPGDAPILFGNENDPEAEDPADDTQGDLAFMDVRKIWVGLETPTTFDVHLKVDDLGSAPPTFNAATPGGTVRASVNYGIELCLDNNVNQAAADGLFCYRMSAVNSVTGPAFSGGIIQRDGTASCGLADLVVSGNFDVANDTVSWRLSRGAFNVVQNSANLAECTSVPIVRGGSSILDGHTLLNLEGSTGLTAGARVIATFAQGGDTSDPGNARPYTFGNVGEPLTIDAGGPYSGLAGAAIGIGASVSGGTGPYDCTWSGPGTFGDAGACITTVSFAAPGTHTLSLSVTDGAGATATDTAEVNVGGGSGERVELTLDGDTAPRVSIAVATSDASPEAPWAGTLDLTGLTGQRTLTATWVDGDGAILDTASVTVTITGGGAEAFVTIDSPVDDPSGATPLSGTIPLSGQAGHEGSASQGAGLNQYGFPLKSGLRPEGLRATVREGEILAPCSGCEGSPVTNPSLLTSVSWLDGQPGTDTDGLDGRWLDVAGFAGASYRLDAEFASPMDIWFFASPADAQSAAKGSKAGAGMPKTGIVPADADWAFVYIRRPTPTGLQNLEGALDNAILTLTPSAVPPSAPQLLEATPGVRSVALNWLAPLSNGGDAIAAYKVYRDGALVDTLPGTALAFTDDGLTPGQAYSYEVSAANSAGEGARAGPVSATPLDDVPVALDITSPADGATGVLGTATIDGTYTPRGGAPPPTGTFANTHYFFLMNLNSPCGGNLGYGDILIASKLSDMAVNTFGMPPENVHFFNEAGVALNRGTDAGHFDQLPAAYQNGQAFDGRATLSNFKAAFEAAMETAAANEAAGGAPARVLVIQSSHGLWEPANGRVFGSLMCLYPSTSVSDIEFGTVITDALNAAEEGRDVSIEAAIQVDCSFCGGFGDSPFWFPGTTTTAVDSAKVVGPNRVIEVGCTWITECFGNPAVGYDHIYNECAFTGRADGYGPAVPEVPVPHPAPTGEGTVNEDVLLPSASHHAKDGVVTLEEGYWCALESVRGFANVLGADVIGVQQMLQLVDQMDGDLFDLDGFVLWDISKQLDLGSQDPDEPLAASDLLSRTTAPDETGDAKTPFGDLVQLDAAVAGDKIVIDLRVANLAHASAGVEDVVEYVATVNGGDFGVCHDRGTLAVYDYTAGAYMDAADGAVAYDTANNKIHIELRIGAIAENQIPAGVSARSRYANCTTAHAPQDDDRVPDVGEISTSGDIQPPVEPGLNEVRVRLDGPAGFLANGVATPNAAAKTWTFDPSGTLADGAYTATAEHWFDDGSGFARVEGPVSVSFTVGTPDTSAPTAPANLFVAATTSTTASLTWDAATDNVGIDSYNVYRSGAAGVTPSPATLVGSTSSRSFVDSGLAPLTDYHYVVEAQDAAGNRGPVSNEVLATTQEAQPITEKVSLTLDGLFLRDLAVDTVGGPDPASWSTSLDTTSLTNGGHTLLATYDDGRGSVVSATARFSVANGVSIAIQEPLDGAPVSQDFTVRGATGDAPDGSAVQVRASNGGGVVQDWTAAAFAAGAWSADFSGMPLGALTIDARLRQGATTLASDSIVVQVFDHDTLAITSANGVSTANEPLGPMSGVVDVRGVSHLGPEADPRANVPPVAAITDPAVFGRSLSASGATSYDPDGSIVSYAWDLGNGEHRSGAALSYDYPAAGTYTATLTVMDDRGAVGQASLGPFEVTDTQPADFVVDAGDSQFVRLGEPLALSARAYGATEPVSFVWDTDGDGAPDRSGATLQVDTTGMPAGGRDFTVRAVDATGGAATDTVRMFLYEPTTQRHTFSNLVPVAINDEDVGGLTGAADTSGVVDQQTFTHTVTVPASASNLDVLLNWTVYQEVTSEGTPVFGRGGPNDFDLFITSPDGITTTAADFNRPEEFHTVAPAAGVWSFMVRSYIVVADTYTLTVDVRSAPANPVPAANQVSDVCFDTPDQVLVASATVATGDPITGAWDLDNDGAFDDATGFEATTHFPADGQAHLVHFRATTSEGYRASAYLGVRTLADCPDAPSVVVVGVADTGINVYHRDFAGELLPDAALRAYTTADPEVTLPDDALVYHKLTGQLLPFTKHPSRYIPGYPADTAPIKLTLGGGYYQTQDTAAVWGKNHAAIPIGTWFWFPGTKIIAAVDTTDVSPINSLSPDNVPILDQDGHGTASASTAAGNFWGSCPRCVLAVTEGLGGDVLFYDLPWVDFISVSGGSLGNIGTPFLTNVAANKAAAERGQTISYAAGNGIDLSFLTPEQTYLSESVGPDFNIRVGAVSKSSNSVVHGTGKPVDWSSYGSGSIAAACHTNYAGNCGHSGTSAATPIATGHMGSILYAARDALGDTAAGQKLPSQANGQHQAIAVGTPVASSDVLDDGVLQRHEMWNLAFKCASIFGTGVGFPGTLPRSQVDYVYGGYGIADQQAQNCAVNSLLTGAALPARADADQFYEVDEAIRDALWGDWDGDGDGQPGGNHNRPDSPALPGASSTPPVSADDLATLRGTSATIQGFYDAMGIAASAPAIEESYFLHHRGGCDATDGGTDYMDMEDTSGDFDGCGVTGTPPLLGETVGPSFSWPSEDASIGFGSGAAVAGTLYLDYNHPGAPSVQLVLLADGSEVGRSASLQPVSTAPAFGIGPFQWTAYAFSFPTTAAIAPGATLQLDAMIQGVESVFVGYEGAHTSGFKVTGAGTPEAEATISSPTQGASFTKGTVSSVPVSGTATFPGGALHSVQVAVDDATFATGTLAVSGTTSWSATWDLTAVSAGAHTLYARAVQDGVAGPVDSVGVLVTASTNGRPGSVEVQAVPEGTLPSASAWQAATGYDAGTGDWNFDWDTDGLANGGYDFHARLVSGGAEVAHDAFRAFLRNSRAPELGSVGDQGVVEGNLLTISLSATDLDDDALSFSGSGMPEGMSIADNGDGTATVGWEPRFDQAGTYDVTFQVSDGGATDTQQVTIVATDAAAARLPGGRGFALVQGAVDAASPGDTVVVLPGTHAENVAIGKALTLCSTAASTLRPADVVCAPNALDTVLAPSSGAAVTVTADGVTVRDLTLRGTVGAVLDHASGGTLAGNIFGPGGDGVHAIGGDGYLLTDDSYGDIDIALRLDGATGLRATRERVDGAATVVSLTGAAGGNVVTQSCIRDATRLVHLASDVSGITLDARGNDWGRYARSQVEAGVVDEGTGNTVMLYPWLAEDCATPLLEPAAAFGRDADPLYAVVDSVDFVDQSTVQPGSRPIVSWAWDFGDGATSNAQDPAHTFAAPGTYTVTLTVRDEAEFTSTASQVLTLLTWEDPTAVLSAAPNPTDRLTAVQFTDSSTAGTGFIVQRTLDFGDGSPTTSQTTTEHTYASLGAFTARLTLRDSKGQQSVATQLLQVLNIPPVAAGSADAATTDRLTAVHFADASTDADGTIVSLLWDFGDGATSTEAEPSHTYASLGTFAVTLTATDNDGGSTTAPIASIEVVNLPPSAAFTRTEGEANRVDPVQFTDGSTDRDGTVVEWLWDFGDGATSTEADPSHTYSALGSFTVSLVVTDSDGGTASATDVIEVVNLLPAADFSSSPAHPLTFAPVSFTDLSTDRDGTIVAWAWDFGNGLTSRAQDPVTVYTEGGFYNIVLTATDNDGGEHTVTKSIFVCDPGGDLISAVDPDHIHLELHACLAANVGDLLDMANQAVDGAGLPEAPPLPELPSHIP